MMIAMTVALAVPHAVGQQNGAQTPAQTSSTDAALQTRVQGKLSADPSFRNVTASVQGGVVDLAGTVPSQPEQKRAKDLVSKIDGVKSVNEHLSIGEASAAAATEGTVVPQTAQSETTKNTAGSIAGNAGAIGATTGTTTPTNPAIETQRAVGNNAGRAAQDSRTQSSQNENSQSAVSSPSGTSWMTPDVDSNTLRSEINSALKSDPTLGNSQLSVDVNDSQITVSGSVPSGKEKQTAVRIVQSYAGNRRVNDKVALAGKQATPNAQTPNSMGTNPK